MFSWVVDMLGRPELAASLTFHCIYNTDDFFFHTLPSLVSLLILEICKFLEEMRTEEPASVHEDAILNVNINSTQISMDTD